MRSLSKKIQRMNLKSIQYCTLGKQKIFLSVGLIQAITSMTVGGLKQIMKLYVSVFKISSKMRREQVEETLLKKYNPACN